MAAAKKKNKWRWQRYVPAAIVVFLVFYLLMELFTGQRSLLVWNRLKEQVSDLESQNMSLQQQIDQLERDVMRLKSDSFDADYVDEQIRKTLPYTKPGEKVIQIPTE